MTLFDGMKEVAKNQRLAVTGSERRVTEAGTFK